MTDRIENIYPEGGPDTESIFISGPAEYLAKKVVEELKKEPKWVEIFGDAIESYDRMDFSTRDLPALRVYEKGYVKQYESWFIDGDLLIDMILPASLRRDELQYIQDTLSSALLQQFRREPFFEALLAKLPGLNEMGKTFTVDKSLGFEFGGDSGEIVPLTQIRLNFRIDLRIWDDFLADDFRTKEDPFKRTLGELKRVVTIIQGLKDNKTIDPELGIDQNIEE